MAAEQQPIDESQVRPDRRVLLFQIDLTDDTLPQTLKPRWTYKEGVPDQAIGISDYSDYDNPRSLLYWRNKLSDDYNNILKTEFENFSADIFDALNRNQLFLRGEGPNPYLDLTPFVRSLSGYDVSSTEMSNMLQLSLARPDRTLNSDQSVEDEFSLKFGSLNGILPRENDVIMVMTRYPGGQYFQEYVGFITKIADGSTYGQIDRYEISVDGISKITKQSDIIRQKAIDDEQFLPNIELNATSDLSVFEDQWNDLDIKGIFSGVLNNVFSMEPIGSYPQDYSLLYKIDPLQFCPFVVDVAAPGTKLRKVIYPKGQGGFQHNFFALLTVFLMTITETDENDPLFPPRQGDSTTFLSPQYYSDLKKQRGAAGGDDQDIPDNDSQVILSPIGRATLEHGDQLAFNLLVANGFELFFSHMSRAEEILAEIRNTSYYELFESREGVMVCRPPRYNKIELTQSETSRLSVDDSKSENGYNFNRLFTYDEASSTYEFNRQADFYIRKEEVIEIPNRTFDDDALESRADVKLNMPFVGSQDFPAGKYTDPDVLLRFGLKTKGPISNPNALNTEAPLIFAPLVLAMVNSMSRTATVTVKDTRRFRVGKLYYIEELDSVGFLTSDSISHVYSAISSRTLTFTMVRRVVRRPLSEIESGSNGNNYEALNMALSYTDDPPDSELTTPTNAAVRAGLVAPTASGGLGGVTNTTPTNRSKNPNTPPEDLGVTFKSFRSVWTAKGIKMATVMGIVPPARPETSGQNNASPANGPRIVMFRYLPSILDIAMSIDDTPNASEVDPKIKDAGKTKSASQKSFDDRVTAGVIEGRLALTGAFLRPQNQQYYEQRFLGDFVNTHNRQVDPSAKDFIPAYLNPTAPVIPAGAINYGPSLDQMAGKTWYEAEQLPSNNISYVATPFAASALAQNPQNIRLSQILVNKLAASDIALKFRAKLSDVEFIQPYFLGIAQIYDFDGSNFYLFSRGTDPNTFLKHRTEIDPTAVKLLSSLFNTFLDGAPQVLRINVSNSGDNLNELKNDFYRIIGSGNEFWLPMGHFAILSTRKADADGSNTLFIRTGSKQNSLLGGKYRITRGQLPNEVVLEVSDPSKYSLTIDDGSNNGKGTTFTKRSFVVSPADGNLYFMTPFAEPTIERLLDFQLPIEYGGQVSQATLDAEKKKIKSAGAKRVITENVNRVTGDSVNLSIDYLAAASGSDLEVFPRRPQTTAVNAVSLRGIWKRFEMGLTNQQFTDKCNLAGFKKTFAVIPFNDIITATTIYPGGGKAPTSRKCLIYSLSLVGLKDPKLGIKENRDYSAAISDFPPQPPPQRS